MRKRVRLILVFVGLTLACEASKPSEVARPDLPPQTQPAARPTAAEAHAFVLGVDKEMRRLVTEASQADWAKSTNITPETEGAAAKASAALMGYTTSAIGESLRFKDVADIAPEDARQLELLRRGASLPSPTDPKKRDELAALSAKMESLYGKGKACKGSEGKETCRDLEQLSDVMSHSQSWAELEEAFSGWHAVGQQIKPLFVRYVELANEGARTIGYRDLGELWRARYDMPPEAFMAEAERLWLQVQPLYQALHCFVRAKLSARYGADKVPLDKPIPAHVLGNMWAQEWSALYPGLTPFPSQPKLDVTRSLKKQKYDPLRMVRLGEAFFTSLGLPALPETFWQRSLFEKPKDREVVCHASAWDVTYANDLRIKMCIKIDEEDLTTIHHELGHDYYFSQYYQLPILFQDGANDGFHEAIGDAIALSMTPAYLKQVGLLDELPTGNEGALNQLMLEALDKVAFLPFGKLIDEWRWRVFSGEIPVDRYNASYWEMRAKYQGIAPSVARGEEYFDAGAKYHVAGNVPYTRYFLAAILQYQFHRALCKLAGHEGPLYACSIYGSKAAGAALRRMLALGAQKAWPDALEALTGERAMDASAILDYYAPLHEWLKEQNKGQSCGW